MNHGPGGNPLGMTDRPPLAERMADAARALQDQADPQRTLETAVAVALENVRGCDGVGISLVRRRRRIETPAHSHAYVALCDALQNELAEGPCLDAIFEEQVVHSADLCEDDRWPQWGPRVAAEADVRSMMCLRLYTHSDTVGAINLYARHPRAFDVQDRDDGQAVAAHVAVAVVAAQKVEQLVTGLDARTIIGQAIGIVMERYDLDGDRAFEVLARLSSHANRKLRDVAEEVVRTRRLPPDEAAAGESAGDAVRADAG